ncbi:MAG: hypothetical protein D6722_07910 [Bacteroidetes bacterium]|nr:MAG: hypothetical protein D6722_07910 [Bacteroidota bacterium]
MPIEQIILVRDETRLERLVARFNTRLQARFYLERAGEDYASYEAEHEQFHRALGQVQRLLARRIRYRTLMRAHVPAFLFAPGQLVLVLGQDGLVANVAKYAGDCPILGINPDPARYDGVLLPFAVEESKEALERALSGDLMTRAVSLAEVRLRDGQRLLAFNDLFIGPEVHISARYQLRYRGQQEDQSSSGILVATGAGATGWLSSMYHMVRGLQGGTAPAAAPPPMDWESRALYFVVREPFLSRTSGVSLTAGPLGPEEGLEVASRMPRRGVIFSDGIVEDYLAFNAGAVARVGLAPEQARLLVG